MKTLMGAGTSTGRYLGYIAAVAAPVLCVALLNVLPGITPRAAVPVLLLAVLVVARSWGIGPALLTAACAALGFEYYFEPLGSGGSMEAWVALASFIVSAVIVGELAAHAERRRREALEGRREIERLYQELEAAFDRASEAEAARRNEQLKAALLDALTHNLRTPLTAIKASVTALMGKGDWSASSVLSSESRRDLLQVIDEESDRLNRFIEGLSATDRPDASQPLRFRPVNVDEILGAGLARAQTATRHHRVHVTIEQSVLPIAVDAAAIVEVIYILLDNASKYSPPDTEIRVTASRLDERFVCIEVADQGPGIPPLLRERVFDKFFRIQGREPTDPHRAGIGLGLPIARRLVEAQAGRIWIEAPASRQGTAVIMTLPVFVREPAAEALAAASS
jgi:two-component system sensor histidine kinase KdpD